VGKAAVGVLRASDPHGSARGVPAEVPRGLVGPGIAGDEKSQGRDVAPAAGLHQIPAKAGVEIEAGGHGELPGIEGKLPGVWLGLRCSGAAGPWRGRRLGVAEQGSDGAGARWRLRVLGLESQEVGGSYL
jgi:hypothetical protein